MTPKQRAFAHDYVKTGGVYRSAINVGYSKSYANSRAADLLNHPEVIAEIKRLRARMDERADKSATDVVNEFSNIAFTDRLDFLKEDPLRDGEFMYKAPDELTPMQRRCIETTKLYTAEIVVVDQDGKPESVYRQEYDYVFAEKTKALEQMGRHFGIFDDKLKLGVAASNPFKDATPQQLEKLKAAWVKTMAPPAIEGSYKEVKNGK